MNRATHNIIGEKMAKRCFCTGTEEDLEFCTFSGDECCGPITDEDEKIVETLLEDLMDTPGLYLNDHYKKKWGRLVRRAMVSFRKTPVALIERKFK